MTEEIRNQLLDVQAIGQDAYEKFRKERFLDKTARFVDTIHRTNLKTFLSIDKASSVQKGSKQPPKSKDSQMQKALEDARVRGKTMEELLLYDVSQTSPLFDDEGFMTKGMKSNIVHELEQCLTNEYSRLPQLQDNKETGYIVDVMATIRKFGTESLELRQSL